MTALDFSLTIDSSNVNQFFADFHMMDVQFNNHRKGINRLDDDDFNALRTKRWHFHQIMMMLDIMDDFHIWCHAMGID